MQLLEIFIEPILWHLSQLYCPNGVNAIVHWAFEINNIHLLHLMLFASTCSIFVDIVWPQIKIVQTDLFTLFASFLGATDLKVVTRTSEQT